MLDTKIQVKMDRFDGPLGLLLLLIQREDMDLASLDLTKITDQYLTTLSYMKEMDFDFVGDYLFLAATLLWLKSKRLLSQEDDLPLEELALEGPFVSEAELVRRLEELKHFQTMGRRLGQLPQRGGSFFTRPRPPRPLATPSPLALDPTSLTKAMINVLTRQQRQVAFIEKESVSVEDKIDFLTMALDSEHPSTFEGLMKKDREHENSSTVLTFMALLELAKLGKVTLFQNDPFGALYVCATNALLRNKTLPPPLALR